MTKRLVILPIGLSLCQDWPYENLYKGAILGEGYPLLLGGTGGYPNSPRAPSCIHIYICVYTLRTMIIVVPPLTFRTYQILPHTNSYFHCLSSYLYRPSPPRAPGVPQGGKAPLVPEELLEKV